MCGPFCFYKDYVAFIDGSNYSSHGVTGRTTSTTGNGVSNCRLSAGRPLSTSNHLSLRASGDISRPDGRTGNNSHGRLAAPPAPGVWYSSRLVCWSRVAFIYWAICLVCSVTQRNARPATAVCNETSPVHATLCGQSQLLLDLVALREIFMQRFIVNNNKWCIAYCSTMLDCTWNWRVALRDAANRTIDRSALCIHRLLLQECCLNDDVKISGRISCVLLFGKTSKTQL